MYKFRHSSSADSLFTMSHSFGISFPRYELQSETGFDPSLSIGRLSSPTGFSLEGIILLASREVFFLNTVDVKIFALATHSLIEADGILVPCENRPL